MMNLKIDDQYKIPLHLLVVEKTSVQQLPNSKKAPVKKGLPIETYLKKFGPGIAAADPMVYF